MKGGEIVTDFEKLFRDYQDFIYKYLLRLTKSYTLAEEFTQETFFRAYMNRASLRNKEKVAVWLCQIAKNIYFSWYNEHKKMQPLDEVVGTEKVDAIEEAYVTNYLSASVRRTVQRSLYVSSIWPSFIERNQSTFWEKRKLGKSHILPGKTKTN